MVEKNRILERKDEQLEQKDALLLQKDEQALDKDTQLARQQQVQFYLFQFITFIVLTREVS